MMAKSSSCTHQALLFWAPGTALVWERETHLEHDLNKFIIAGRVWEEECNVDGGIIC